MKDLKNTIDHRTCSEEFRDEMLSRYPALENNIRLRRFFWHLLGYNNEIYNTKHNLYRVIENINIFKDETHRKYYDEFGVEDLRQMFRLLGHGKATDYRTKQGRVRYLLNPEWPEDILLLVIEEIDNILPPKRIYWMTGTKYGRKPTPSHNKSRIRTDEAKAILKYLDNVAERNYHIDRDVAIAAYQHIKDTRTGEALTWAQNTFKHVLDIPKPSYIQPQKSNRLFDEFGLQNLPKDIRSRLWPHWIDLDLRNCQLSILAQEFFVRFSD